MIKKLRSFLRTRLDENGHERLSPIPKEPIIEDFQRPPTLEERISRLMRYEREKMQRYQDMSGFETPEEADDFDIEDDPIDMSSPYEEHFMPQVLPEQALTEDASLTSPVSNNETGEASTPQNEGATAPAPDYATLQKQIADLQAQLPSTITT